MAVADGADELDYVINMAHVKNGKWHGMEDEMAAMRRIKEEASRPLVVKAILETGYLTGEELVRLCKWRWLRVRFRQDVHRIWARRGDRGPRGVDAAMVGEKCGVKASGGIRTRGDAVRMVQAGANRIGTSPDPHFTQVKMKNDPHSG